MTILLFDCSGDAVPHITKQKHQRHTLGSALKWFRGGWSFQLGKWNRKWICAAVLKIKRAVEECDDPTTLFGWYSLGAFCAVRIVLKFVFPWVTDLALLNLQNNSHSDPIVGESKVTIFAWLAIVLPVLPTHSCEETYLCRWLYKWNSGGRCFAFVCAIRDFYIL